MCSSIPGRPDLYGLRQRTKIGHAGIRQLQGQVEVAGSDMLRQGYRLIDDEFPSFKMLDVSVCMTTAIRREKNMPFIKQLHFQCHPLIVFTKALDHDLERTILFIDVNRIQL